MYTPAGIYLQPPKLRRRKKDKIEAKGKQQHNTYRPWTALPRSPGSLTAVPALSSPSPLTTVTLVHLTDTSQFNKMVIV